MIVEGDLKPSDECSSNVRMFIRVFQKRSQKGGKEVREMVRAEDVTNRMRSLRVAKGLTIQDVAERMGKTRQAVNNQELNPLGLSVQTLIKYASIYGCEVADFFVPFDFAESKIEAQ